MLRHCSTAALHHSSAMTLLLATYHPQKLSNRLVDQLQWPSSGAKTVVNTDSVPALPCSPKVRPYI